jgi:hypothetical protein
MTASIAATNGKAKPKKVSRAEATLSPDQLATGKAMNEIANANHEGAQREIRLQAIVRADESYRDVLAGLQHVQGVITKARRRIKWDKSQTRQITPFMIRATYRSFWPSGRLMAQGGSSRRPS